VSRQMSLSGGGSVGSLDGVSSADYRVIVGLKYALGGGANEVRVVNASAPNQSAEGTRSPQIQPAVRAIFTPKQIQISEEIKFEHDSDVLKDDSIAVLDEVASLIRDNKTKFSRVRIEGHANELGTETHNQRLSEARAKSVRRYLVKKGIEPSVLAAVGFGQTRPKDLPDETPKVVRLQENRRVDFQIEE
jgi:outer membrane protein OmpA-like peptidoglycan-associated protein